MRVDRILLLLIGLVIGTPPMAKAQAAHSPEIASRYRWNLADLFPSDSAWTAAKDSLYTDLPTIADYRGTLAGSSGQLLGCLELIERLNKEYARLFTYANLKLDLDMRNQATLSLAQEVDQAGTALAEATAFIEPEILTIAPDSLRIFQQRGDAGGKHRRFLTDLLRGQSRVGTAGEERLLALVGPLADAPANIYDVFINADFPYPEATLHDGGSIRLDLNGYGRCRASANREDRHKACTFFLTRLNEYRGTLGALMNAQVQKDLFHMAARSDTSCLKHALAVDDIPIRVYSSLVDQVNLNLPTLHRYLGMRQRMLEVDTLHYYDMSAPLTARDSTRYSIEEAQQLIQAALAPLGGEVEEIVATAFRERWIDVFPAEGKRSGGYCNGWAYDVHPYVLINYDGSFEDVLGLAHELGHALQSHLSNTHQPFTTANCPRFIVEVAATVNEALLINHMLQHAKDDDQRLSLLGRYLDNLKTTVFRATQVAEFEARIHQMAENGEQLTGDMLNEVYLAIARNYHGHDKQVCLVDEEFKVEWAIIPQLYSGFYAYQYATSCTASSALAERILMGDRNIVPSYLEFLSAGGSDSAVNLLSQAGIDLTVTLPFDLTMRNMNRAMDEMERILARKAQ